MALKDFIPCLLKESPTHRHDLLKKYISQGAKTILDVGGSSYVRYGNKWVKSLGAPGKSWNVTYFSNPQTKRRKILTLNVERDYNRNRRPDIYYDGLHIPFKDNSFDVVTCVDVFEHMPREDRRQVLSEIVRIAKRRVLVTFPFKSSKKNMEQEVLSYVIAQGIEPKASLIEHERYGLPIINEMEAHLKQLGCFYNLYFATDREILKQHFFHQASINRLIKDPTVSKESVIKEIKKLEKINYKELGLEQTVKQNKAYRVIIVIDKTKKS